MELGVSDRQESINLESRQEVMVPHRRQPAQHLRHTSGRASRAFHGGRRCRRTSYTRPTASRIPGPQPTTDRMRSGEDSAARCRSDTARGQSHTRTHGRRASTQILHGFCDTCSNQARSCHIKRCTVRDDTEARHNRNSAAAAVNRRHIHKPGTRWHR